MKAKLLKRILIWVIFLPVFLISLTIVVAYFQQDAIVQSQIEALNENYQGRIEVGDVHLAPFSNFPEISLKVDDVAIYEYKADGAPAIMDVADIYIGFNIWDLLVGTYDIHSVLIEDGFLDVLLHTDGRTNLDNALSLASEESSDEDVIDIHLSEIEIRNLDIHQREESTGLDIETFIYWAKGAINTTDEFIDSHVDTEFELNVIDNGDTTYLKHKHFEFHTDIVLNEKTGLLKFEPSGVKMEHGDFLLEGSIDTKNDMTLDIDIKGTKPSFDMFIAFAPEELIPVLERYDNAGKIYFNASLKGPTTNGRQPLIDVNFGAREAYLENSAVKRRIDEMGFSGHFTNGEKRNFETMEFSLTEMTANLEKGKFIGNIFVRNFEEPDIEMQLDADFEIPFIVGFLNLQDITDASGSVDMHMKFHDVIDLEHPEKALSELNQAYYAELNVDKLHFSSDQLPAPLNNLDVHLEMKGKEAQLDEFIMSFGNSDISITGYLSDLPAIVHHTHSPVTAHLEVKSDLLDIAEITDYSAEDSTGVDEEIRDLSLALSFNAMANDFTEFKYLPKGEFFIDDLYADLRHYPHTLHDFHADVMVKDDDLSIVDFTGLIDESDFHFNGLIHDYGFWMQDTLNGDIDLDITLRSDLIKFDNLFAYRDENHVPKDYQHEEIDGFILHMESSMHYKDNELTGIDLQLDELGGKMHVHPLRFEDFSGRFHFENKHLVVEDFKGKLGRTNFDVDMNYFMGKDDSIKVQENSFALTSDFIDFDALTSFNLPEEEKPDSTSHEEAYNLYELPFSDMQFNVDIANFIYHRIDLQQLKGQLRTTHDHYIYLDTLSMKAAGGSIAMNGVFNGNDPKHIYLKPNLVMKDVDLDKLMFKFENFGQDELVSDNLHGDLTAKITGNIRIYPDMVADLDHSEVHLDAMVLNGRLENYEPMLLLSDYFGDRDLTNIRFDTLANHIDVRHGTITIPNMTIESTIGHMDISGSQDMEGNIDYYIRIPWSLVREAAKNKIFGSKEDVNESEDEIVEVDPTKNTKYLNLNIHGTLDDYSIKLKKAKGSRRE